MVPYVRLAAGVDQLFKLQSKGFVQTPRSAFLTMLFSGRQCVGAYGSRTGQSEINVKSRKPFALTGGEKSGIIMVEKCNDY